MNYATLPIRDYFEKCRRRYEKLLWFDVPGLHFTKSKGAAHHFERILTRVLKQMWQDTKAVYHIYKKSGWPAVDYDRVGCMQQLQEWLERR